MKVLIVLNLIQLLAILSFGYLHLSQTHPSTPENFQNTDGSSVQQPNQPHTLDALERKIAAIVRDEIRQQDNRLLSQINNSTHVINDPVGESEATVMSQENEYYGQSKYQLVNDTLETHIADGFIDKANMVALQQQIAQLNEQNRKEMLGKLVRALNSGQLEGEL